MSLAQQRGSTFSKVWDCNLREIQGGSYQGGSGGGEDPVYLVYGEGRMWWIDWIVYLASTILTFRTSCMEGIAIEIDLWVHRVDSLQTNTAFLGHPLATLLDAAVVACCLVDKYFPPTLHHHQHYPTRRSPNMGRATKVSLCHSLIILWGGSDLIWWVKDDERNTDSGYQLLVEVDSILPQESFLSF